MALQHDDFFAQQNDADRVRTAVAEFGSQLAPKMRGDGYREERLRNPVHGLLEALGGILGRDVVVHEEVPLSDHSVRPDFAVDVRSGRVGFVELKAPEKGIPDRLWRPTKHDREQLRRLSALQNLIYTNGQFWGLYRRGSLVGNVAVLDGDLASAGHRLRPADGELEHVFRDFLTWKPDRPTTLRGVVADVAPLCRLLRDQVAETMVHEKVTPGRRPLTRLAGEWREILFPNLTEQEFADAYAQAVTFALLLARVDGIGFEDRSLTEIATQLSKQHSLMGEALSILTNLRWIENLSVIEMLRRVVGNIDWDDVQLGNSDAYTLLYETFLAEYDPRLRRQSGTYYTPDSVARAMVRFANDVLTSRMHKQRGLASDDVFVIDPAMGTGTFLVEIIDNVAAILQRERGSGAVPQSHLRELFSDRLIGFELQVAPYAVAELRLDHTLHRRYGVELPRGNVRFLSNTLDNPDDRTIGFGQLYDVLQEEREGADRIKRSQPVMVVIGNPPWREQARGAAPWLEAPRDDERPPDRQRRPSLDDFRTPGQGRRAFNLKNMWTFFWRWATWKAFEANPDDPAGLVILITPKPYLTSESYTGMRRYLRETADEGWIIDLSPEGFQPTKNTRVFPEVQQPICIGAFARYGDADPATPAVIRHTALQGTRSDKFRQLTSLSPDAQLWRDVPSQWEVAFQPIAAAWSQYPKLSDLLPWHLTGVNSNRNWVWAPDRDTLRRHWSALIHADGDRKAHMFKETRDRQLDKHVPPLPDVPSAARPLCDEDGTEPLLARIAYRSFDRQWLIHDGRVIDFARPALWQTSGPRQIYVSEQHAHAITDGTALTFTSLVPNVDHFNGRGGRVLPLYRDPDGRAPNISPGLLRLLASFVGDISAEDLLAYVAAVVGHSGYRRRFRDELRTPGVRVPLTRDRHAWRDAVALGREVLWLHTYGERCVDPAADRPYIAPRLAVNRRPRMTRPILTSEHHMPATVRYVAATQRLTVGEDTTHSKAGIIEQVPAAVWEYSAGGGVPVVQRWFSYRLQEPRRKKRSSPLDRINPSRWTAQFDDELFDLLNVLGRLVDCEERQTALLDRVCDGPLITISDLEHDGVLPLPDTCRRSPRRRTPSDSPTLPGAFRTD